MAKLMAHFALAAGLAATGASAQTPGPPNFRANVTTASNTAAKGGTEAAPSRFMARDATANEAAPDTPPLPQPNDVNVNAPYWFPIEKPGEAVDYFRYFTLKQATTATEASSPDFNNEVRSSTYEPHRPGDGFSYAFQPSAPVAGETQFAGCALTDQPDNHIHWFGNDRNGVFRDLGKDPEHDPQYRSALPSEFNISSQFWGAKGFTALGAPQGNAPGSPDGSYAIAVMYMTDRRCSDGNNEYGFWQELASKDEKAQVKDQPLYFYYSTRTNCFEGWGCRAEDDPNAKPVEQQTGGLTVMKNLRNFDADKPPNFYYSAYMVPDGNPDVDHNTGYKFRIQVVDAYHPDRLATCNVNDGPDQPCAADVPIGNFFPAQQVQNGPAFAVTGTQTAISGNGVDRAPKFDSKDAKFNVKGLYLGR